MVSASKDQANMTPCPGHAPQMVRSSVNNLLQRGGMSIDVHRQPHHLWAKIGGNFYHAFRNVFIFREIVTIFNSLPGHQTYYLRGRPSLQPFEAAPKT